MTDSASETTLIKRTPKDAFERQIFRQSIQQRIDSWPLVETTFQIGDYSEDAEAWVFYGFKYEENFDIHDLFKIPTVEGWIWLEERQYPASDYHRVVVRWLFPDAQENIDFQPVIAWDFPDPAGPF